MKFGWNWYILFCRNYISLKVASAEGFKLFHVRDQRLPHNRLSAPPWLWHCNHNDDGVYSPADQIKQYGLKMPWPGSSSSENNYSLSKFVAFSKCCLFLIGWQTYWSEGGWGVRWWVLWSIQKKEMSNNLFIRTVPFPYFLKSFNQAARK